MSTLKVTLSQTSRGDQHYMQIISDDQQSINIVLIADKIEVTDARDVQSKKRKKR